MNKVIQCLPQPQCNWMMSLDKVIWWQTEHCVYSYPVWVVGKLFSVLFILNQNKRPSSKDSDEGGGTWPKKYFQSGERWTCRLLNCMLPRWHRYFGGYWTSPFLRNTSCFDSCGVLLDVKVIYLLCKACNIPKWEFCHQFETFILALGLF
jgi:hypothetical protein